MKSNKFCGKSEQCVYKNVNTRVIIQRNYFVVEVERSFLNIWPCTYNLCVQHNLCHTIYRFIHVVSNWNKINQKSIVKFGWFLSQHHFWRSDRWKTFLFFFFNNSMVQLHFSHVRNYFKKKFIVAVNAHLIQRNRERKFGVISRSRWSDSVYGSVFH